MYKLALALRYLQRKRITILAIGGTALGVLAFIVVLGVMQGFTKEMRQRMRGVLGDLTITSEFDQFVPSPGLLAELENLPNVKAYSGHLSGLAILKIKGGEAGKPSLKYCMFKGVDPTREARAIELGKEALLTEGGKNLPSEDTGDVPWLVGGKELLDNPEVNLGDMVKLVIPEDLARASYFRKEFRVAGKFSSGMYEFDSKHVYIPLWAATKLKQTPGELSQITLSLDDPGKLQVTREKVDELLARNYSSLELVNGNYVARRTFRVRTYEEANQTLFTALKLQTRLASYILVFYFLVAGFVIIAIMSMMVLQKTRDIGIMRAIGGSTWGILRVFLHYGLTIGIIGAAIGAIGGLLLLNRLDWIRQAIVRWTGWDPFPAELYYFEHIPRQINLTSLVAVLLGAVALGLVAALYPAIRAARMDPARTLRYE